MERLAGAYGNNVWEYRTSAPKDWNTPIPEWSEANEDSLLTKYSRERAGKSMAIKLANEIIDSANETGNSIRKREEIHRMAEANKAFAHYRF